MTVRLTTMLNNAASGFIDRCMPYKVRTSCGHIVIRQMRQATAGVPWSEDVVLEAPGGMPCVPCQAVAR